MIAKTTSCALTILVILALESYAVADLFLLDDSNTLASDIQYASVILLPCDCFGGKKGVQLVVYPNDSVLIPGSNFGIQRFGFNYDGDPKTLQIKLPPKWSIGGSNMSEFGSFDFDISGKGNSRQNPLVLTACHLNMNLYESDFLIKNDHNYIFAAHIADFTVSGRTGINSAYFGAKDKITLTELSEFDAFAEASMVHILWSTESEIDNAGFNLYRAESEDGEYTKINNFLIPAEGSPTQGASYQYTDNEVRNRKTYWYKLEDIDLNGVSTMHGTVSATPKFILGLLQ